MAPLTAAPVRVKNFGSLCLGLHSAGEGEACIINIASEETKTKRRDDWALNGELAICLDRYLGVIHPRPMAEKESARDAGRTDF